MKKYFLCILFIFIFCNQLKAAAFLQPDVYLVLYATNNGKTGHIGIAVDNYLIQVYDKINNGAEYKEYDTVKNGNLTYYDLWPADDGDFDIIKATSDIEPKYYKLPSATWEPDITLYSLLDKGIPHEEGYPCDGIILIPSTPADDYKFVTYLDSLIDKAIPFNAWKFNCADFVQLALEKLTGKEISADEFIFFGFSTTPNKLFRVVMSWPKVKIIRNPGKKVYKSFTQEKVFNK